MGTKFKGIAVNTLGDFHKVGERASNFILSRDDLSSFRLSDAKGRRLVLNIFPSLDTSVCAMTVRKFNEYASRLKNTLVLCISKDLPFAQSRFCVAEGISNVLTLSDFHYASTFGKDYGVQMVDGPLNGLFARAIVVIDEFGKVIYSEMTDDIVKEPNYDAIVKLLE